MNIITVTIPVTIEIDIRDEPHRQCVDIVKFALEQALDENFVGSILAEYNPISDNFTSCEIWKATVA